MSKRISNVVLCMILLSVYSTAIDCGCGFAHAAIVKQVAETKGGHCDQHESGESSKESEESCCVGCVLETAHLNSNNFITTSLLKTNSLTNPIALAKHSTTDAYNIQTSNNTSVSDYSARGVPNLRYSQPIYISDGSFLV